MSIYKVACWVTFEADSKEDASNEVFDILNHAVRNYDGFLSAAVDLAVDYDEEFDDEA